MNLNSILSYPERGSGGDNRYRGNCSPKLIADLLGFFKPAQVCDYMCGSGTTADAAASLGIDSRATTCTAALTCSAAIYPSARSSSSGTRRTGT